MRQPGNMVRLLAYASKTRMEVAWEPQHVLCQVTRWRERKVHSFVITSSALPVRKGLSTPASLIVAVSAVDSIPIAEVTSLYQVTTSNNIMAAPIAYPLDIWCGIFANMEGDDLVRCRLVCKAFDKMLCPMVKRLDVHKPITQEGLEALGNYPNLTHLNISQEYDDNLPLLSWQDVHLKSLESLSLDCCPMTEIFYSEETTPALVSLSIQNQGPKPARGFEIRNLPELTNLDLQFVSVRHPLHMTVVPAGWVTCTCISHSCCGHRCRT